MLEAEQMMEVNGGCDVDDDVDDEKLHVRKLSQLHSPSETMLLTSTSPLHGDASWRAFLQALDTKLGWRKPKQWNQVTLQTQAISLVTSIILIFCSLYIHIIYLQPTGDTL